MGVGMGEVSLDALGFREGTKKTHKHMLLKVVSICLIMDSYGEYVYIHAIIHERMIVCYIDLFDSSDIDIVHQRNCSESWWLAGFFR